MKVTDAERLEASNILKILGKTFRNLDLARQIGIKPDYISFCRNMSVTSDGKQQCPEAAIRAVLAWSKSNG